MLERTNNNQEVQEDRVYDLLIEGYYHSIDPEKTGDALIDLVLKEIETRCDNLSRINKKIEDSIKAPSGFKEKFRRDHVRRKRSESRNIAGARAYANKQLGERIKTIQTEISVLKGKTHGNVSFVRSGELITGLIVNFDNTDQK